MSLDHFRDYFHSEAFFFNPTDPLKTNMATFSIRWVTHYCAPVFTFLAGVSAYIVGKKYDSKYLSRFLIYRGLWLIFVEIAIMNFGWRFDFEFSYLVLQVIWMLGVCMILLALLIRLTNKQILIFSILIIFGHNLLDLIDLSGNFLWAVVHKLEFFKFGNDRTLVIAYPIIPWVGVMSLGYYFGQFFTRDFNSKKRVSLLKNIGAISMFGFFVVRFINQYGNSKNWVNYEFFSSTIFSFFDPEKYPPSLSYLLMTIGPMFLFLAFMDTNKKTIISRFFMVFGKVPFFFYILHVYFIHFFAMVFAEFSDFGWELMILKEPIWMLPSKLEGYGLNTFLMLALWICFVLFMYPFCKKFGAYKANNKEKKWLSYL